MQTENVDNGYRGFGRAGRAAGRFVRDALYTELMPKGLVDYKQSYSTTLPAAAVVRLWAKGSAISALVLKMLYDVSTGDGQTSSMTMEPMRYLAFDAFANSFLFMMNHEKRKSRSKSNSGKNLQDSLEDQPATLAIEVPYRVVRGIGKAVKHFANRKKDL